jgi:hypothetical protein
MRLILVAINTFAAICSLIWLWGHSSTPANDWEFWFAFGYLFVALANLYYFFRRGRAMADADEP